MKPKSQARSAIRRIKQAYERQKANLAEPPASKTSSRGKAKNLADFAKNGVFQQYRLVAAVSRIAAVLLNGLDLIDRPGPYQPFTH